LLAHFWKKRRIGITVSSAVRQPLATVTGYGIRKTGAVQMGVRKKLAGQGIYKAVAASGKIE